MAFLDLWNLAHRVVELPQGLRARVGQLDLGEGDMVEPDLGRIDDGAKTDDQPAVDEAFHALLARRFRQADLQRQLGEGDAAVAAQRSEEHTSELQSLMRLSYAVFCMTKKKIHYKDIRHRKENQP